MFPLTSVNIVIVTGCILCPLQSTARPHKSSTPCKAIIPLPTKPFAFLFPPIHKIRGRLRKSFVHFTSTVYHGGHVNRLHGLWLLQKMPMDVKRAASQKAPLFSSLLGHLLGHFVGFVRTSQKPFLLAPTRWIIFFSTILAKVRLTVASEHPNFSASALRVKLASISNAS